MPKTIEGVLTAIVTPFTATGDLNLPALKVQINRQLAAGNAIFCGGTNGEFFVLNEQEKLCVTQTCVDEVAGKRTLVKSRRAIRFVWGNRLRSWALMRYRSLPLTLFR